GDDGQWFHSDSEPRTSKALDKAEKNDFARTVRRMVPGLVDGLVHGIGIVFRGVVVLLEEVVETGYTSWSVVKFSEFVSSKPPP
ncbi:hypothetical protein Tco_0776572, partial [Tanacetum coccineum]